MSNDIRVLVESTSKKFCRSLRRAMLYGCADIAGSLIGRQPRSDALRKDEFWALKDVSFELRRGESLGLIGANGAGKSTLLKLLNGIIAPDIGCIRLWGRVGALIEIGAGFHPMLTGRENIFVNGAILGLPRREIARQLDAIIAFSGVEDFIDTPVKFYSPGMYVRLGFAVAAHLRPDILLVDEVLAVGDMAFQARCLKHVSDLSRQGCTVIFVSHNEELVRRVCDRGILLEQGQVICQEDLHRCFGIYHSRPRGWIGEAQRAGNGKVEITEVELLDEHGDSKRNFHMGAPLTLRIHLVPRGPVIDPVVDIGFNSAAGYVAASANTKFSGHALGRLDQPSVVEFRFPALNLSPGLYRITALVCAEDLLKIYDWRRNSWEIVIENDVYVRGAAWLPFEFRGPRPARKEDP